MATRKEKTNVDYLDFFEEALGLFGDSAVANGYSSSPPLVKSGPSTHYRTPLHLILIALLLLKCR